MPPEPPPPYDRSVANRHLGGPLTELASGVDALYLSARAELPASLLARLEDRRALAEGTSVPIPFDLGPECFGMAPHAWGRYRYCLEHPDGRVGISPAKHVPAIRVQPRSAYLHTVGPEGAVARFAATLGAECGPLCFSVSRVDVYADYAGWDLGVEDRSRFVCRADSVRTYEANGRLTGFEFGKRSSKTLSARIYDKTADVVRTGADWWFDVWNRPTRETGVVHRVEFEVNREGLAQFGLSGADETLRGAADLWRYCTVEWLTHRSPRGDANRARWPLSPAWTCVQRAQLSHGTVGAERVSRQLRCGSLRKLTPGLTGYLVGFAVLSGTSAIDDTLEALGHHLREDEVVRRTAFSERVRRRRMEGHFR